MDKMDMNLERVFTLIASSKLGDYTLEKQIGLARGSFSNWRKEKSKPSTEALLKMANYFDVSIDYLLFNTNIKKPTLNNVSFDDFINALNDKKITESDLNSLSNEQYSTIADIIKNFKK